MAVHPYFALIKVTKVMYLIVLIQLKNFLSFWKIPPFNNFVNFNTSKLINNVVYTL